MTRCKSASLDANASHSGRQECSASAARHLLQITQPQDRISVASEFVAGSIPAPATHRNSSELAKDEAILGSYRQENRARMW